MIVGLQSHISVKGECERQLQMTPGTIRFSFSDKPSGYLMYTVYLLISGTLKQDLIDPPAFSHLRMVH